MKEVAMMCTFMLQNYRTVFTSNYNIHTHTLAALSLKFDCFLSTTEVFRCHQPTIERCLNDGMRKENLQIRRLKRLRFNTHSLRVRERPPHTQALFEIWSWKQKKMQKKKKRKEKATNFGEGEKEREELWDRWDSAKVLLCLLPSYIKSSSLFSLFFFFNFFFLLTIGHFRILFLIIRKFKTHRFWSVSNILSYTTTTLLQTLI